MLNYKLADAYVLLSIQGKSKVDSDLDALEKRISGFPGTINVAVATAGMSTALRMAQTLRADARTPITWRANVVVPRGFSTILAGVKSTKTALASPVVISVRMDPRPFYRTALRLEFFLNSLRRGAAFTVTANAGAAHATLNLLMQHMRTAQGMTRFRFTGSLGPGFGFGGGGRGGGGGFLSGLAHGAGLPYAYSPQAAAGQLMAQGIAASVRVAADIQSRVAELRRITGYNAGQAAELKAAIFRISTTQAGVSVDDLLSIAEAGGRMGIGQNGDLGSLTTYISQLAKVKNAIGDMPTDQLAENMGKVLNVFELGTDRIEGFGSALAKMDNLSIASAQDILAITTGLSGTARSIGLTLPQVLALSSVLKDVGLSNQLAASSFSQIFRKMAADTDGFARKIGVSARAFREAYTRDPLEAMGMVIAKFKEMESTVEGQEFLAELGFDGVRTAGALQQLAAKFDEVGRRAEIASAETASLNALTAANQLKGDLATNSFQKFKNAMTELGDTIGQKVLPMLTEATTGATALVKVLSSGKAGGTLKDLLTLSVTDAIPIPTMGNERRGKIQKRIEDAFIEWFHGDQARELAQPNEIAVKMGLAGPGKEQAGGLPAKPQPKAAGAGYPKFTEESAKEFKKEEQAFARRLMGGIGAARGLAGARLGMVGAALGGNLRGLVRSVGSGGGATAAARASRAAELEAARRSTIARLAGELPAPQRAAFLRRANAGLGPTREMERNRAGLAGAIRQAQAATRAAASARDPVGAALADVEARRKASLAELERALPASQRTEFRRRAGRGPTDADRRLRPVFAQALEEASSRVGRFRAQRAGILAASAAGRSNRTIRSGMSSAEMMGSTQDAILNRQKHEEKTAKSTEQAAQILGRIEGLLKKLPGSMTGGMLGQLG